MSFGYLNIEQTLKAVTLNESDHETWLNDVLSDDPYGALVEVFDLHDDAAQGPLKNLPILIKDNICVKGRIAACGSLYLKDHRAHYNATVVDRLLKAGCRLKGRTNMDEFAMGSSTEYSAFGPTQNPWDSTRVPGGSSGGSAAAVAAGWVPVSLGSDTGGSVRQPAALCGVFGYKPTYGLLSRYGLVAFASSFDQIGLFSRDVDDLATVMKVISGHDESDSTSLPTSNSWELSDLDLSQVTIGVLDAKELDGLQDEIAEQLNNAIDYFKNQGASVQTISLPSFDKGLPTYYIMALAEASANLARYDGVRYGHRSSKVNSLDDVYMNSRSESLGLEVKRRILLGTHVLSSGYFEAYYTQSRKMQRQIQREHETVFNSVDVMLTPTTLQTAFKFKEKSLDPVKMYQSDRFTVCANHAGLPAISLPVGLDRQGLPIGLQCVGGFNDDVKMLSIARRFAQDHPFNEKACHDL